ncbi:MAG: nucleotidyltransferase family protein [Proteobacteria bacterium]|nr:nucleotidyltransferase family protein [Pseudomonadota bacterium]HQR04541.1 nucleotidyltransferase family protein [Rhodocyclaceae bacterium]
MNRSSAGTVAGLLLAAGSGQRFGGDKLLTLTREGMPMGVQAAHRLCRALAPGPVYAAVRADDHALAAMLKEVGCQVVTMEGGGMGDSLARLVTVARSKTPAVVAWLVALADMPWVREETLVAVAAAAAAHSIPVAPCLDGRRGHPVGFPAGMSDALCALTGDTGARGLIERLGLHRLEVDDDGILRDVDTPADLDR